MLKEKFRLQAIDLRRQGYSYSEILQKIPVAKSTLSLWLQSVGLSNKQKHRLTSKQLAAAQKGGAARRQQRLAITERIYQQAEKDVTSINDKELWLMGIMLYWAEGSKEKDNRPGIGVIFSNSDPLMVKIFTKWLVEACKVSPEMIRMEIFIHESFEGNIDRTISYWLKNTGFSKEQFRKVYFKKHSPKTNYKNSNKAYYGLARIKVRASSSLNRKISGWIRGINNYYSGIV